VWFSGVHCDIGGGNPEHKLSDIPLQWMVSRARSCGLHFKPEAFAHCTELGTPTNDGEGFQRLTCVAPDALGNFDDSRTGMYRLIPDRWILAFWIPVETDRPIVRNPFAAQQRAVNAPRLNPKK
jgi:hypothetical protein